MKPIIYLLLGSFFIFQYNYGVAQTEFEGGGEYVIDREHKCLSDSDRQAIFNELDESIEQLKATDQWRKPNARVPILFDWPLKGASNLTFNSYYGVSNYVDHDPGSGLEDYDCTARTYNGHRGIDVFNWPFSWYLVDNDLVEVIAAAPGQIISKSDGNDDDHCSCFGQWNAVYIQHGDGSIAWYGHLKENSLTTKAVGQFVAAGEYLGIVASSGCSTGPHLHLEVYDGSGDLVDPYAGPCNTLNANSWWQNQPPFSDPNLNAVLTHDAVPVLGCPSAAEMPNFANSFSPGDAVITAFYYRDQQAGNQSFYRIKRPDGSTWLSWSQTSPSTYVASYWYWTRTLPASAQLGQWTLEATYMGQTVVHTFEVADALCTNPPDNIWTGPAIGDWHQQGSNWSRGFVPLDCDNVVIPAGYVVTVAAGEKAECNTLQVANNAILDVLPSAELDVQQP